jgi:hypothetical protein
MWDFPLMLCHDFEIVNVLICAEQPLWRRLRGRARGAEVSVLPLPALFAFYCVSDG